VEVRYDPFDIGTIHAFVDNQWVECHSEYYHAFQGRSHKELMVAAEELRKRWQNHSSHSATTAKRLAEFLAAAETQETVLAQRRADMEVRRAQADSAPSTVVAPSGITQGLREMLEGNNTKSPEVYGEF
jgi:putative transposase